MNYYPYRTKESWLGADNSYNMLRYSGLPKRKYVEVAIACAESVFHFIEHDDRIACRESIDCAKGWLNGTCSIQQCRNAYDAAVYARGTFDNYAAYAAGYASYAAFDVDNPSYAASFASVHAGHFHYGINIHELIRSLISWQDIALAQGICHNCYEKSEMSQRGLVCLECNLVTMATNQHYE